MFYKVGDIVTIRPDIEEYRKFHVFFYNADRDGNIDISLGNAAFPGEMMMDICGLGLHTRYEIISDDISANDGGSAYDLYPIGVKDFQRFRRGNWVFTDEMLFGPWCPGWYAEQDMNNAAIPDDALMAILAV